ncbi:TPA: UPF0016 domain-containing protein [candidate division CPR2 bacterium]|nr:UPF0016 domain-containing protein [candidate division CPR2 bacterium]
MLGFFATFGLIALAELGDKTQLLALSFATKYKQARVILGIGLAILVLQFLAAMLGEKIGNVIPQNYLQLGVGILFIGFGIWSLRKDEDVEKAKDIKERSSFKIILTIALLFFVAELGDKTQLATFSLAAKYNSFWQVWAGSVLGLLAADVLAILAGLYLGKRLPHKKIQYISASAFIFFGLVTLGQVFL